MEINLVQAEIQEALIEYVSNQGFDVSGKDVIVTLSARRGNKGHTALIEILPEGQAATAEVPAKKQKKAAEDEDVPAINFNTDD